MTNYELEYNWDIYYDNQKIESVDLGNIPFKDNSMVGVFSGCSNLQSVTNINENVINMGDAFFHCYSLTDAPIIPKSVTNMHETFYYCNKLTTIYDLNEYTNLTDIAWAFGATKISKAPKLPNSITNISMSFAYLYDLVIAPDLSDCTNLTDISRTFINCNSLTGDIYIGSNQITNAINCFVNTSLNKNVYIPFTYQNGDNTLTYNSFINAGYTTDPNNRINGVCLFDLNNR